MRTRGPKNAKVFKRRDRHRATVQAVARAADLLYWLADHPDPARFSEICRHFRTSKGATHRLLTTLADKGLVAKDPNHTYALGSGAAMLGTKLLNRADLVASSRDAMRQLWERFAETITLSVRVGTQRFCVYQQESPHPLRYALPLATPQPLYCGATGKLLLAMMPDAELHAYLAATPLVRIAPNSPTEADAVLRGVEEIRARGYATSIEEAGAGGVGVAAPILGPGGRCVGVLGVIGPATRLTVDGMQVMAHALLEATQKISSGLGAPTGRS